MLENRVSPHLEVKEIPGVVWGAAAIVLNEKGEILTGRELQDKPSTNKRTGDISIPLETLKSFEIFSKQRMLEAVLTEFTTDETIEEIKSGMYLEEKIDGWIPVGGTKRVVPFILHWRGRQDLSFQSQTPEEFGDLRWMSLDDILKKQVRPYARTVLEVLSRRNYLNSVNLRSLPVNGYKPSQYSQQRDAYEDLR